MVESQATTVDVWCARHHDLTEINIAESTTMEEHLRAQRFATKDLATRFLAGRAMTRLVLAEQLHIAPLAIEIVRHCAHCGNNSHGKPRISGDLDLWFSLSLTDALSVVALSNVGEIGCDVVALPSPVATIDPKEWAVREAAVKCDGRGLALNPWSLLLEDDRVYSSGFESTDQYVTTFELPIAVGAVASPHHRPVLRVRQWVA